MQELEGGQSDLRRGRWIKIAGGVWVFWAMAFLVLYLPDSPYLSATPFSRSWSSSQSGSSSTQYYSMISPQPATTPTIAAQEREQAAPSSPEPNNSETSTEGLWASGLHKERTKTLVVYVYFEKNLLYKENLQFFLDVGVSQRNDVDYVFVLQGNASVEIPSYPNVRVLEKENDCMDFGGWRYALDRVDWRTGRYRYFVFMNSSVRGPYVPLYVPRIVHWTALFTQLLRNETGDGYANNGPIKLVGLTINCATGPHVQSMMWATDLEALEHLNDRTSVITCKPDMTWAINTGELALSYHIKAKGWNIGSLAVAYRGWDFRVKTECNGGMDPNLPTGYYDISPALHETLFVKTNREFRTREVQVYSRIATQQAHEGAFDGARFTEILTS